MSDAPIEPVVEEPVAEPVDPTVSDIDNRFGYHAPKDQTCIDSHALVREQVKAIALDWSENLPFGREQALAVTKLEEAMFWANAAIARNQ